MQPDRPETDDDIRQQDSPTNRLPDCALTVVRYYSMHADDTIAAHVPIRGLAYARILSVYTLCTPHLTAFPLTPPSSTLKPSDQGHYRHFLDSYVTARKAAPDWRSCSAGGWRRGPTTDRTVSRLEEGPVEPLPTVEHMGDGQLARKLPPEITKLVSPITPFRSCDRPSKARRP